MQTTLRHSYGLLIHLISLKYVLNGENSPYKI